MSETLYKVLGDKRESVHGGSGRWTVGRWRSVKGPLVACENGIHLCREQDLVGWIGPTIWLAEYDGERLNYDNKIVVRRARVVERIDAWHEKSARLFAADCAERVLPIFERAHPDDDRPRRAIEAARAFARGEITVDQLVRAAWAASAARATWAASAASAAWDAWAAWDASAASAASAASDAERTWQTRRLLHYLRGGS